MQTAPGIFGTNHDLYIRDRLAVDKSIWRISSWHKNMRLMQVGEKTDETGWGVYEESRAGGAIIATAHDHSYSRTHLLSNCESQTVASTSNTLVLASDDPNTPADEGRSFAFVSALGGMSIYPQLLSGDWWASIYTSNQGATYGALFGVSNYQGDPRLAHFYFKDIDGNVRDEFFVQSSVGVADGGANEPPAVDAGPDQAVTLPDAASLDGTVTDDGIPSPPGAVTTVWSLVSGPGTATFADPNAVDTAARFSGLGTYFLRLTASDGELVASDEVTVTVNSGGNGGGAGGGSGGCFIATAAYGSPMAEQVKILTQFRNEILLENKVGKTIVELYYRVSPPIARFIAQSENLKMITRWSLWPMIGMSWLTLNYGPSTTLILYLRLVIIISIIILRKGRRVRI